MHGIKHRYSWFLEDHALHISRSPICINTLWPASWPAPVNRAHAINVFSEDFQQKPSNALAAQREAQTYTSQQSWHQQGFPLAPCITLLWLLPSWRLGTHHTRPGLAAARAPTPRRAGLSICREAAGLHPAATLAHCTPGISTVGVDRACLYSTITIADGSITVLTIAT